MIDIKNSYFIVDNVPYVIVYSNLRMLIFKREGSQLTPITDKERKKIRTILNNKIGYNYNSDLLNEIIDDNKVVNDRTVLKPLLEWLESTIPSDLREKFYHNLGTLKLNYSKEVIDDNACSDYNARENIITIYSNGVERLLKLAQAKDDSREFFAEHYLQTYLHELCHMASSHYDEDSQIADCGFDRFPAIEPKDKNRGLTEGMTELMSTSIFPGILKMGSSYYLELCLASQLSQIIGYDSMVKAYFSNNGTIDLERELNSIDNNPDKAFALFRDIENNYQIGDQNIKQNILGNIQDSLLDYLDIKCKENKDYRDLRKLFNLYESNMITPERLMMLKKDPANYDGVSENIEKFNRIKEKYLSPKENVPQK